jgi:hypothetical protein
MVAQTNPLNEREMGRLRQAMTWSNKKLRPFRQNRLDALKQYVGKNFTDSGGATAKVPVNMIWMAITIYQRHLVPQNPKALVLTKFPELKPSAYELQLALNHLLTEINYGETAKLALIESMFSMGIIKVGIEVSDVGDEMGYEHDAGQPFADVVLLDDWIMDMTATSYEAATFAGNKYRLPYEVAKNNKEFNKSAREKLSPQQKSQFSMHGSGADHRAESIVQGSESFHDGFMDFVEVWDLWLPRQNLLLTMSASEEDAGTPLQVREWQGPEHGPYHLLRYQPVPGTPMPIAPVMQWTDLSDAVNRMWRKLIRQSERQKEVLLVQSASGKDGEALRDSNDGEIVSVQNPQGIQVTRHGGIDQQTHAFSINTRNQLGYLMGNIDAIGGLGAQTSTLGQDQMLSQSANRMIDDMRQEVSRFHRSVMSDLARYLWEDPYIQLPLVKRVGNDVELPFTWTPEQREGDFAQYNVDIEPYSLRATTPEERLAKLNQILTQLVIPMGMQIDQQQFARTMSEYTNLPELEELLRIDPLRPPVGEASDAVASKSQQATTTSERISRAGPPTREAQEQQEMQALLSAGDTQAARPAGNQTAGAPQPTSVM